jgi:enterobacteria phage integrase
MTRRRPLPPFVELWRDRHGRIRVYFRRARGPRIALPVDIRSAEFAAAYHEALTGSALSDAMAARNAAPPGSIEALIRSYRATREYGELRATTRSGYDFQLESLRREHGHRSVSGMTRANIEKLLAPLADRPGAALARLKMLKVLIAHAIVKGWLTHDPSLKIKRPKGGKIHTWTEGEL